MKYTPHLASLALLLAACTLGPRTIVHHVRGAAELFRVASDARFQPPPSNGLVSVPAGFMPSGSTGAGGWVSLTLSPCPVRPASNTGAVIAARP